MMHIGCVRTTTTTYFECEKWKFPLFRSSHSHLDVYGALASVTFGKIDELSAELTMISFVCSCSWCIRIDKKFHMNTNKMHSDLLLHFFNAFYHLSGRMNALCLQLNWMRWIDLNLHRIYLLFREQNRQFNNRSKLRFSFLFCQIRCSFNSVPVFRSVSKWRTNTLLPFPCGLWTRTR